MKIGYVSVEEVPEGTYHSDWVVYVDGKSPDLAIQAASDIDGRYEYLTRDPAHYRHFPSGIGLGSIRKGEASWRHTATGNVEIYYYGSNPRYDAFRKR